MLRLSRGPQLTKSRAIATVLFESFYRERLCYRTSGARIAVVRAGGNRRLLECVTDLAAVRKLGRPRVRCTSIKSLASAAVRFHSRSFRARTMERSCPALSKFTPSLHGFRCRSSATITPAVIASERRASLGLLVPILAKNFSD